MSGPLPAASGWWSEELVSLLREAQDRHFVGPTSLSEQLDHSAAFAELVADRLRQARGASVTRETLLVDLGSGGGLPGLVLAVAFPSCMIALVEGSTRRAAWLTSAVERLGLAAHVVVLGERAELLGRSERWRERAAIVTARAFGPPAVVAECAAPLLLPGGSLVVSEPPDAGPESSLTRRWPETGLSGLGFGPAEPTLSKDRHFVTVPLLAPCPDRFPRRVGVPSKRPIF